MRALLLMTALLGLLASASAQSGRGRPSAPPPKPTPRPGAAPPPTVLNVPEGGKILRQDVESVTARYKFKNGLTVIVRQRPASPLAAVTTYVKAGSLDDPEGAPGLARLAGRMFLTPAGAAEVRRRGGRYESRVAPDYTSHRVVAPVESLMPLLEVQAGLLLRPHADAAEVKRQALLLAQEAGAPPEDAAAYAAGRMLAAAFAAHRLKRPALDAAALQAVTPEQLQSFYQTRYQPQNVIVSIVGGVFAPQLIGRVQQLYGELKAGGAGGAGGAAAAGPEEPPQVALRYGNERGEISQTYVTVGYHVPGVAAGKDGVATRESLREQATLEVLAAALGLGRGARLARALRESERPDFAGTVSEASAEYGAPGGVGMLMAQLRVEPGRIDRGEAEYFRELERFRRELMSEGELGRALAMIEKRYHDGLVAVGDEAEAVALAQARLGDFRLLDSHPARVRAVTAEEVQRAAAQYLTLANTTVFEYEPRSAPARTFTAEKFAELVAVFAPTAPRPVDAGEVKRAVALRVFKQGADRIAGREGENVLISVPALPVKDFSVLRGPRAYVREDRNHPLLSVGVYFQGGRLVEDQAASGTTELMLRAMLKSTTTRKGDLIALELESYGGELSLVNEPDFFGFTLDVLSRNAEGAVKVLLDIIENPYFDPAEVARERVALVAGQLARRDEGAARAVELLWASLYPGHPYGLPRFGLPAAVKAANEEKLEAWHAKSVKRQFPLVILVGDTDGSALVSRIFSEGFKRGQLDQTLKVNLPALTASPEDQAEPRGGRLTAQAIGFRAPAGQSADYYALEVLRQFAAGPGGRLAAGLRAEPRLAGGAFYAYTATPPEEEARAGDAARAALERLAGAPPSEDEFELGRAAAIGAYAIEIEPHPARSLEYARAVIFGRKAEAVDAQPDLIRAVKKADIQRAAAAVIKPAQAGRGVVRGQ